VIAVRRRQAFLCRGGSTASRHMLFNGSSGLYGFVLN
jgi:hypothetical protein